MKAAERFHDTVVKAYEKHTKDSCPWSTEEIAELFDLLDGEYGTDALEEAMDEAGLSIDEDAQEDFLDEVSETLEDMFG